MKKILLALFGFIGLCTPIVNGQTFTPAADTVNAFVGGVGVIHDDLTNITSSPLSLRWHVIATNFPADWLTAAAFGICDNGLCRNNTGDTFLWNASTGMGTSFTSAPYTPSVAGTFDLSLNMTSVSVGCHYVTIGITDVGAFYTKNITFNICKVPTNTQTVANTPAEVVLYPNPATNELNVVYGEASDVKTIAIYSIIGKVMSVYKVGETSANLNLENIPSGVYFVRLMNSHGDAVVTRKFTKQ